MHVQAIEFLEEILNLLEVLRYFKVEGFAVLNDSKSLLFIYELAFLQNLYHHFGYAMDQILVLNAFFVNLVFGLNSQENIMLVLLDLLLGLLILVYLKLDKFEVIIDPVI